MSERIKCPACGEANLQGPPTCDTCGASLKRAEFVEDSASRHIPTAEEVEVFVGENAQFYADKWSRSRRGSGWAGFNWAACLGGLLWFVFRKMYWEAAAIFAGLIVLPLPSLVMWVSMGLVANTIYLKKATRTIARVTAAESDRTTQLSAIAMAGGTSRVALLVALLAVLALILVETFLLGGQI